MLRQAVINCRQHEAFLKVRTLVIELSVGKVFSVPNARVGVVWIRSKPHEKQKNSPEMVHTQAKTD